MTYREQRLKNVNNCHWFRWMLVIAVVLAIPILPFLWFGKAAELQVTDWLDRSCPSKHCGSLGNRIASC